MQGAAARVGWAEDYVSEDQALSGTLLARPPPPSRGGAIGCSCRHGTCTHAEIDNGLKVMRPACIGSTR